MKKIIFVNSHPIQYFAPMYKYLNDEGVTTACWYCSNIAAKGAFDNQFNVEVKWDIPLLEGYEYKFFKNHSWKPSHFKGFFGLMNFGMLLELFRTPKSVIVVHGWHYFTLFFVLMIGKVCGHTVCLRCDVPQSHEVLKEGWVQIIKRIGLKYLLFPRINFFLYIGKQNFLFYKSYGISEKRLLLCPYSVDNHRFQTDFANLASEIPAIKNRLGIHDEKVIIFSAKYIPKKRPLDILRAFSKLNQENVCLIMIGEGELRGEMESFIKSEGLKKVLLTGFVNQSKISEYYAIGDLFVMCSGLGENWGLSVNEAMNFNLPLILSDLSGCSDDLVKQGVNGYTFTAGDVDDLVLKLKQMLLYDNLTRSISSTDIINDYSYNTIFKNISALSQIN